LDFVWGLKKRIYIYTKFQPKLGILGIKVMLMSIVAFPAQLGGKFFQNFKEFRAKVKILKNGSNF
jgi:hypothetical protein